eukprot:238726_1
MLPSTYFPNVKSSSRRKRPGVARKDEGFWSGDDGGVKVVILLAVVMIVTFLVILGVVLYATANDSEPSSRHSMKRPNQRKRIEALQSEITRLRESNQEHVRKATSSQQNSEQLQQAHNHIQAMRRDMDKTVQERNHWHDVAIEAQQLSGRQGQDIAGFQRQVQDLQAQLRQTITQLQQPTGQPQGGQPQGGQQQTGQPQSGQPQGGQQQGGQQQGGQPQGGQQQYRQPQGGQQTYGGQQQPPGQQWRQPPQGGQPVGGQPQGGQPMGGQPSGEGATGEALVAYRRGEIVKEFKSVWDAYSRDAFGKDLYLPFSRKGMDTANMGLQVIDAMDTLVILGMDKEFDRCKAWVLNNLNAAELGEVGLFETTIRVIGGLLSAHTLKPDPALLGKAQDIANRIRFAFSDSGIPFTQLDVKRNLANNPTWTGGSSLTSEVMSIQLEFQLLTRLTGHQIYERLADRTTESVLNADRPNGLFAEHISPKSGQFTSNVFGFGASIDSAYENLLKQWLFSGKSESRGYLAKTYYKSIDSMMERLLKYSKPSNLAYLATLEKNSVRHSMEILTCFVPGMLALGATPENPKAAEHLKVAEELAYTCYQLHKRMGSGLAPEVVIFSDNVNDFRIRKVDAKGLLRPETIESLFVLYRTTKKEKYREWAWEIFESMRRFGKVPSGGFAGVKNVQISAIEERNFIDRMEGYHMSQTFKYMFLLYSDPSLYSLDKYVFSTEGHLFPVA